MGFFKAGFLEMLLYMWVGYLLGPYIRVLFKRVASLVTEDTEAPKGKGSRSR